MNRRRSGRQPKRVLTPPPDAKRPLRVSPCQSSVLWCPTPKLVSRLKSVALSKGLEELAREGARVQAHRWHRGGQRNQRRKRATTCAGVCTGGVWTTTPPFAHACQSIDVSRLKVGRTAPGTKSREDTRSTTEVSNRSWDVPQICKGASAPSGRRRRNRRCPGCAFQRLLCPGSSA